jgi:hypothetical protein
MTNWSQLQHAYGSAEDVPGLLDAASSDPQAKEWDDLWSRLCHQGTVYSASFAALPALTRIARHCSPADRQMPLILAGAIVASSDRPYGSEDPQVTRAADIAALLDLTEEALRDPALADDDNTYVYLLQAMLSFEGVDLWAEQLDGLNDEEYEVPCPACASENFVAFGQYGCFSTTDSMYMRDSPSRKLPLEPQEPSQMQGLARRLHARALADGHPDIAHKLTFVFGRASCADCETDFDVAEAINARWRQ